LTLMKLRILVVADDAALRATLARWLLAAGYAVELAEGAKRAREVLAAERVPLAILAADQHGVAADLARELLDSSAGVIAIIEEVVEGSASIPASSYLSKPVSEQDVLARVDSLLQDTSKPNLQSGPDALRFEGYTLDIIGRACIDPSGAEVALTRAEFSLLLVLAQRAGRVLSRDELRQAILGRDAEPDDRSVDMLISRLRRKIEPDPKAPRMIVTVPGVGYKFSVKPQAADPIAPAVAVVAPAPAGTPAVAGSQLVAAREASAPEARLPTSGAPEPPAAAWPAPKLRTIGLRHWAVIGAAAVLASIAGLLLVFWHPPAATNGTEVGSAPLPKFDASLVPLVSDAVRRDLASYAARPDFKSLAISPADSNSGWGVAFGALDAESAKKEALERCSLRSKTAICRTYAIGMGVVWSPTSLPLPLPADLHAEPLTVPVSVEDIPAMNDALRRQIGEQYLSLPNPKALAIRRQGFRWNGGATRAEAIRLTLERCGDILQVPCLLLSVDGLLTIQIPKSHVIEDIFMVATEPGMSAQDRDRVAQVYQGKEWRALARGKAGWYPVAELPSEASASEAALAECNNRDSDCRLYAIGNFRVGAER
jgi:DNA-binding response OmpR family regulator